MRTKCARVPAHAQMTERPPCPAWTSPPRYRRREGRKSGSPAAPPGLAFASGYQSEHTTYHKHGHFPVFFAQWQC